MGRAKKIGTIIDFIEYISKSMEKRDLFLLYKVNGVNHEKLEMFSDFTYTLNDLIMSTYLGDDYMSEQDKVNHFKWCWSQTVNSFKKEGVYFIDAEELYDYFLTFYQESFYTETKVDGMSNKFSEFWGELLTYDKAKTMSEYETLIELYKIFNKSFLVN